MAATTGRCAPSTTFSPRSPSTPTPPSSAPRGWRCATGCCRTGSTTQLSYLDEAGQAELLAAELDGPTVTQLKRQKTPWSTTLDDDAQSIVEFGRKIGATERRRQGLERQFAELDTDSASSSEARQAWITVVKAIVGAMELAGLSEEQRERLLGTLDEAAARTDREVARANAGAASGDLGDSDSDSDSESGSSGNGNGNDDPKRTATSTDAVRAGNGVTYTPAPASSLMT